MITTWWARKKGRWAAKETQRQACAKAALEEQAARKQALMDWCIAHRKSAGWPELLPTIRKFQTGRDRGSAGYVKFDNEEVQLRCPICGRVVEII